MSKRIQFRYDGKKLDAEEGQTIAAALIASGVWPLGRLPGTNRIRGPFCGMGVCFECEVLINEIRRSRSCMLWIEEGMNVRLTEIGAAVDI